MCRVPFNYKNIRDTWSNKNMRNNFLEVFKLFKMFENYFTGSPIINQTYTEDQLFLESVVQLHRFYATYNLIS